MENIFGKTIFLIFKVDPRFLEQKEFEGNINLKYNLYNYKLNRDEYERLIKNLDDKIYKLENFYQIDKIGCNILTSNSLRHVVELNLKLVKIDYRSYFDIIPKELIVLIISKLSIHEKCFREMFNDISDNDIIAVCKLPDELMTVYNTSTKKYQKIFKDFNKMGMIYALNSRVKDVFILEEYYPYLKIFDLWKTTLKYFRDGRSTYEIFDHNKIMTNKYCTKSMYNELYIRINGKLGTLLDDSLLKDNMGFGFDWISLNDNLKGFNMSKYSITNLTNNKIIDDSFSIAFFNIAVRSSNHYSTLKIVASLILKSCPEIGLIYRSNNKGFDYNTILNK